MEVWKKLNGYEGYYEISDHGNVRSVEREVTSIRGKVLKFKGKTLKLSVDKFGYRLFSFKKTNEKPKRQLIHRCVLSNFVGEPPSKTHQCAHKDGDPGNNHVSNLRWATPKENGQDKVIHGTTNKGGVSRLKSELKDQNLVAAIRVFPIIHGSSDMMNKFMFDGKSVVEPIRRKFTHKYVKEIDLIGTDEFNKRLDELYELVYHTNWSSRSKCGIQGERATKRNAKKAV